MADKLNWLNQHPIWFIYPTLDKVIENNNLNLSTSLMELAKKFPVSEDYVKALWSNGLFKDACTFCAYNTSPRVAVWWAYSCVVDLRKEILLKPIDQIKIEDIAKPRPLTIPDWCNPSNFKVSIDKSDDKITALNSQIDLLKDSYSKLDQVIPRQLIDFIEQSIESTFASIKKQHGHDPRDLLNDLLKKLDDVKDKPVIDLEQTPIFKATQELEQKIEGMRQETIELINSVIPENDPQKEKSLIKSCLDGVWAYINVPNEHNASTLLNLGNSCPNLAEGLLALVGFWSFGLLTPNSPNLVKTPAGLLANGINGLITKCAATPGGVYKPVERFERYFNLAFACLTNQSTWDHFIERNTCPHQEIYGEIDDFMRKAKDDSPSSNSPDHSKLSSGYNDASTKDDHHSTNADNTAFAKTYNDLNNIRQEMLSKLKTDIHRRFRG